MTEEQLRALTDELRGAIADERAALQSAVLTLGVRTANLEDRAEALAFKLRDVTEALVVADGALSQRLDVAEGILKTIGVPELGPYDTYLVAREAYFPKAEAAPVVVLASKPWYWPLGKLFRAQLIRLPDPKGRQPL